MAHQALRELSGRERHAFFFFSAANRVAAGVFRRSSHEFVGDDFLDGSDCAEASAPDTFGDEPEGEVDAAHRGDVAGGVVADAAVGDAGGFFAGGSVLDGLHENLNGVAPGAEVDELEGGLDVARGGRLLASDCAGVAGAGAAAASPTGSHEAVDEALDNGDVFFAEPVVLVASEGVRDHHWIKRDVLLQSGVADFDVAGAPSTEYFDFAR